MSAKPNRRLTRSSTALLVGTSSTVITPSSTKKNRTYTTPYHNSVSEKTLNGETTVEKSTKKAKPTRKIVKAKRLLRNKTVESQATHLEQLQRENQSFSVKPILIDQSIALEHVDLTKEDVKTEESVDQTLRKENSSERGSSMAVQNENLKAEEKINVDSFEERRSSIESTFIITDLSEPISPSTTGLELNTTLKSPEHLQFNCSEETLHPTTTGGSAPRRTTFELETSVNDITLLKSVSESDSVRMNSIPSAQDSLATEASTTAEICSKVTVRRRWNKSGNFPRISKFSPPWSGSNSSDSDYNSPKKSMSSKKSDNLLKNVLIKEKSKSAQKPLSSNVKVPNFAAIHQRAFDKMENLSEYKQRKEERAKMLLSGRKPTDEKSILKESKKSTRKHLTFAADVVEKKRSSTFIPLPSTPMPKHKHFEPSFNAETENFNFPTGKENVPTASFNFIKQTEISVPTPATPKQKPFGLSFKIGTPDFNFSKKIVNGPVFFERALTKNVNEIVKKTKIPKKILSPKNKEEKRRFPLHKAKNTILNKEDLKIMVTTKSKPMKVDAESRRTLIKGVRSNRRFDLLMQMRKGK